MDQKIVRKLEDALEEAVADALTRLTKGWQVPLLPSRHTMHLMAKAAVAVYEAAVEADEAERRQDPAPE